jgi:hypothetical protein
MKSIKDYEAKYNREPRNNFAVACYNDNSLEELLDAIIGPLDLMYCVVWSITAVECRDAILAAYNEKLSEIE